jgi:hypothetical protein
MKISKEQLRILAISEQLMDEGKVPWVMAPSIMNPGRFERLPISPEIMTELGLKQGQTINSIIFDAIAELASAQLKEIIEHMQHQMEREVEQNRMNPDFDFRNLMNEENKEDGDEPTKH